MHGTVEVIKKRNEDVQEKNKNENKLSVNQLSVEELRSIIIESAKFTENRSQVTRMIFGAVSFYDFDDRDKFVDHERWAPRVLKPFIGQALPVDVRSQSHGWRYIFDVNTTTGLWHGYALRSRTHADGMLERYNDCLLFHLNSKDVITSAALVDQVNLAHRGLGLGSWTRKNENVFGLVGSDELGDAIQLDHDP